MLDLSCLVEFRCLVSFSFVNSYFWVWCLHLLFVLWVGLPTFGFVSFVCFGIDVGTFFGGCCCCLLWFMFPLNFMFCGFLLVFRVLLGFWVLLIFRCF